MPHCVLLRHAIHARPETLPNTTITHALDSDYTHISDDYRQLFIDHCQNGHSFPEDEIVAIDCQFSRLVGTPMAVLCNASTSSGGSGRVKNARASRLTTDVSTGKHTLVYGNVLVVPVAKQTSSSSNASGGGVEAGHVEEIDNAIHDEVLEYFCQGLKPMPKDIQRIVREFVSGKFKYTAYHHHHQEEEEKKKKEEEEAPLPGWG
ncbi:hypothetical protein M9435_006150 [Picochlorum sp. BPE23]|nr:hypothetical protein M9435_006150 [Picochlorum sp. BPE23]